MGAETIAYIALATAAVGTTASIVQGQQAQKQQEKAAKAQSGIAAIEDRRARVKMIRESQAQQANLENMAVAENVEGGSGFQGQVGALSTQTAGSIADFRSSQQLQQRSATALTKASRHQATGQLFQGLASMGSSTFNAVGGYQTLSGAYPEFFGVKKT